MSDPVTITICGMPSKDTLAALFDLAVSAGLGLALQPRALPPVPLQLPAAAVTHVKTRRKVAAKKKPRAEKPVRVAKPEPKPVSGPVFAVKPCARCSKPFTPGGPRAKYCAKCRESLNDGVPPEPEMEVVWNGSVRR